MVLTAAITLIITYS